MFLDVYQTSTTGGFGYVAMEGNQEMFQTGCAALWNPEVWIDCQNGRFRFQSPFDREITMVPGQTTRKINNVSGNTAAILRFEGEGFYTLLCPGQSYTVEDRGGKILAFSGSRCVLTMKRVDACTGVPPAVRDKFFHYDVTPYYTVTADPELPLPTVAIMATFPMLRFDYDHNRAPL